MIITFGGHEIFLHQSGLAILPHKKLAVVSDMHLEKASHFAQRGFFLPPYDSHETLQRLLNVLVTENIARLLILGDCFHDGKGYQRLTLDARLLFDRLCGYAPVWITGNHDGDFVPQGFMAHEEYTEDNLIFRHQAKPGARNEISGHYHPKAQIIYKGAKINKPCFAEDDAKLLMPAFGAYAGGLFVDQSPVKEIFKTKPCCYLLGQDKVFKISAEAVI